MSEPLRIGVLGAARITEGALVQAAALTGDRIVVVAARDRGRAETHAAVHGIERVAGSYQEVVDDPEVDVVYNPLANGLHGPWNLRAIAAGKHVLSEKPYASNATEARLVRDAAQRAGVHCVEAFHYLYHPVMQRVLEIAHSGEIGDVTLVDARMLMPPPPPGDARWSSALAGGSVMDVGCYALHAARDFATMLGGEPVVVGAKAGELPGFPGIDAWLEAELAYPSGVPALVHSSMTHGAWDFSLRVVGTKGEVFAPSYVLPHQDDRVVVTVGTDQRTEHLGTRSSYTFQLEALRAHLRDGVPFPTDAEDAVATMALIDDAYVAAGMSLRPTTTLRSATTLED